MGHNVSDRKRRAFLVSARLADVRDWLLIVECARCRHRKAIPIMVLPYRGDIRVGDLLPRLHCQACRAKPERVAIARVADEIVLFGPGAYS